MLRQGNDNPNTHQHLLHHLLIDAIIIHHQHFHPRPSLRKSSIDRGRGCLILLAINGFTIDIKDGVEQQGRSHRFIQKTIHPYLFGLLNNRIITKRGHENQFGGFYHL